MTKTKKFKFKCLMRIKFIIFAVSLKKYQSFILDIS